MVMLAGVYAEPCSGGGIVKYIADQKYFMR